MADKHEVCFSVCRVLSVAALASLKIPVVDLALSEEEVTKQVFDAFTTYGFFYLKNHGIQLQLMKRFFEEMDNFFSLPMEEKMKLKMNEFSRGYQDPYRKKLDVTTKKGDSREGFYVGLEDLQGVFPDRGPNQWPDGDRLAHFRPTIEEYFGQMRSLMTEELMRLIALSLDVTPESLNPYLKDAPFTLLMLHYFPDISKPEEGAFACGEHTDWGMLTVLITESVQGLQVKIEDRWIDVPHKENMFIVNVADMLERLTNGVYKSGVHRVITKHGKDRYSAPCFLGPNTSVTIAPLPQLCKDIPAKYEPICFGDYLMTKYKKTNSEETENN